MVKGLGSLFNKRKKQQQDDSANANAKAGTPAPPPNPNPDPNALMEMTTQVSSFSDAPLDGSLFDIPAGYAQVQGDPNQMLMAPAAPRRQFCEGGAIPSAAKADLLLRSVRHD